MSQQPKRGPRPVTAIPQKLHLTVFNWKAEGLTNEEVLAKLEAEHGVKVSKKPLSRLMKIMREEHRQIVSNVMTEQAATQIERDFQRFGKMHDALEKEFYEALREDESAGKQKDLRTATHISDRLIDIHKIKFGIATGNSAKDTDPERHRNELIDGLIKRTKSATAPTASPEAEPKADRTRAN